MKKQKYNDVRWEANIIDVISFLYRLESYKRPKIEYYRKKSLEEASRDKIEQEGETKL